ncbi:MAG: PRC-barrel domain-containing protein [Burkholderiaceae bacterium]
MLRNTKDLEGFSIGATDGEVGTVKDFYFDDKTWVIRYLVVDTGAWLMSRKVLISPIAIGDADWVKKALPVSSTKQQVKDSPAIDTERPVSRQHEIDYAGYYGYPFYWGGDGLWGGGAYPNMMLPGYEGYGSPSASRMEADNAYARAMQARREDDDPHLRSCDEVAGYHLHATDGDIGHVHSMLIDEKSWAIRYLVVDTSNWWMGHKVLISPEWIDDVNWSDSKVSVKMSRDAIKNAPPYDPNMTLSREHEKVLYRFHDKPGYWGTE